LESNALEIVGNLIEELPWFLIHMVTAFALTLFYVVIYMWVTPHSEIKLIQENNMSASLAFSGSLIGFCIPFTSAIINSVSLVDVLVWGVIALLVQIVVFYIACVPIPKISERIEKGEIASGLWLGSASLAGGLLNAASMTN
jgi:putative membrane protein